MYKKLSLILYFCPLLFLTCGILNPEEKRTFKIEKIWGRPIEFYLALYEEWDDDTDFPIEITLINYTDKDKITGNVKFFKNGWWSGEHFSNGNIGFIINFRGKIGPRITDIGFFEIEVHGNSMKGNYIWSGPSINGATVSFTGFNYKN